MSTILIELPFDRGLGRPVWPRDAEGRELVEGHGAVGQWPPSGDTCVVRVTAPDAVLATLRGQARARWLADLDQPKPVEVMMPARQVVGEDGKARVEPARTVIVRPAPASAEARNVRATLARCGVTEHQWQANGGIIPAEDVS